MKTALFCCLALTLLSLSATETIILRHRHFPEEVSRRPPPDRKKSLCRNVFNRQEQPRSMFVPTAGINRKKPGISFLRQESSGKTTPHIYLYRFRRQTAAALEPEHSAKQTEN